MERDRLILRGTSVDDVRPLGADDVWVVTKVDTEANTVTFEREPLGADLKPCHCPKEDHGAFTRQRCRGGPEGPCPNVARERVERADLSGAFARGQERFRPITTEEADAAAETCEREWQGEPQLAAAQERQQARDRITAETVAGMAAWGSATAHQLDGDG